MDRLLKILIDFGVLQLASPLSQNGSDCFFLPHGQVSFIAISEIGREAHRPYLVAACVCFSPHGWSR